MGDIVRLLLQLFTLPSTENYLLNTFNENSSNKKIQLKVPWNKVSIKHKAT